MDIGQRLRVLRESKKLSQGEIEKRTGLLRCYISRVENGHTVPAIKTLETMARAFEMPLYQLLYDGDKPPGPRGDEDQVDGWGRSGRDARFLNKLCRSLCEMDERERNVLLTFAKALVKPKKQP